jgi:hypothetical protein
MWDAEHDQYLDTNLPARGEEGRGPIVLPNGNYGNWDEASGDYVDSGVAASTVIDIQNETVEFVEAPQKENIQSGENIPTLFGKISKWFATLGALAWKSVVDYTTDVVNKPAIPTKTSDLSNDTYLQNETQVNAKVSAHNTSDSSHGDMRAAISAADAIARGKSRALVFETEAALNAWLSVAQNRESLQVGDNFYIRQNDVPDYWWDGMAKQELETEKVDLSDFFTKEQSDNRFTHKAIHGIATLEVASWVGNNNMGYTCTVANAEIIDGCTYFVLPVPESSDIAGEAGLYELPTAAVGSFTLKARNLPTGAITIHYIILQ